MKEFKVGETFQFGLIKLKCVKNDSNVYLCDNCYFTKIGQCIGKSIVGPCLDSCREDNTDVIFVKVEE